MAGHCRINDSVHTNDFNNVRINVDFNVYEHFTCRVDFNVCSDHVDTIFRNGATSLIFDKGNDSDTSNFEHTTMNDQTVFNVLNNSISYDTSNFEHTTMNDQTVFNVVNNSISFEHVSNTQIDQLFETSTSTTNNHIPRNNNRNIVLSENVSQTALLNNQSHVSEDNPCEDLSKFSKSNSKNMIFSHLNINSLSSKFMEMNELLTKGKTDVLFLSETKLDSSYPSAQFNVDQFTIHRLDRNAHGGGLICYIRDTLPHKNRADIAVNENGIETIAIQIKTTDKNMFFLHVYRPPNTHINHLVNALETMLNKCFLESEVIHVIGDLNVNFSKSPHHLSQLCDSYDLKQLIKNPTCFKSLENPTLLDVILTSNPKSIKQTINIAIGISDFHNYISASTKIKCPTDEIKSVHYRSFKKFSEEKFIKDVESAPFHVSEIFDNANDQLWFHNSLLLDIVNANAPKKQKFIKHKQLPYMNDNLRKAINVKASLCRKFQRTKTQENWDKFRKQRNLVNKLKRSSLNQYFQKNCNNTTNKNKHFWDIVKPFMTNKVKTNHQNITLFHNDSLISKQTEVSNVLNEYYVNVTNDLCESDEVRQMSADEVIDHYKDHPSVKSIHEFAKYEQPFNFEPIQQSITLNKLKQIQSNKATGFDNISPKFLKIAANNLSYTLTPIINNSFLTSTYPESNKHAEVTPLYKKSDRLAKENYRPLSVLSSTSKIFEGVMCDQLLKHVSNSLSVNLSAYRKSYSCNNVLVKCIENWREALDNNCHVGCILIDLSKAFDSLPHGLLIAKLHAYGISMEACSFIMNYLKNRKQAVKLGNVRGDWFSLKTGVPQGSLMGPLLFNIFINDFLFNLEKSCEVYNYADDNTLSYSHKEISIVKDRLEKASEKAIKWFQSNYMRANPGKFQAICLSKENMELHLHVENDIIKSDSEVKLLGVHIDHKLNFSYHLSHVCKKAARQINALQRICKYIDYEGRLRIYEAFVASNFVYCSIAYNNFSLGQDRKIEKLNERALRLVCNDYESTYNELLLKSGKKMLCTIRKNNLAEFVYKVLKNVAPPIDSSFFDKQTSPYDMRDNNKLVQPAFNTMQYGRRSIRYQGPSLWNVLPPHVKCSESLDVFKSVLRRNDYLNTCECGTCILCLRNSL